jgi:hypothetical protein
VPQNNLVECYNFLPGLTLSDGNACPSTRILNLF